MAADSCVATGPYGACVVRGFVLGTGRVIVVLVGGLYGGPQGVTSSVRPCWHELRKLIAGRDWRGSGVEDVFLHWWSDDTIALKAVAFTSAPVVADKAVVVYVLVRGSVFS